MSLKSRFLMVVGIGIFLLSFVKESYCTASTHIWAPSTDIQAYKKWHITSDYYVPTQNNADGSRANTITNFGITIGVLPMKKLNAEIGLDHKSGYGALDDYPWYFNTKIALPEKAYGKFFPAIAIGIYDLGTEKDKTNYDVWYTKLAKTVSMGDLSLGRFSLGYFRGSSDLLLNGTKKDNDGLLAAWERVMPEISDKLWLCVDYQGTQSSYGAMNLGFSWKFSDNVSGLFGYDIYNDRDLAETYTVQVDMDF
jgi:hypothetical protein